MTSISANYNLPPRQDPDAYARSYATQNGISIEEAREQLKAKYGDPKPQNDESLFTKNSLDSSNTTLSDLSLDDLDDLDGIDASETGFMTFIRNLLGLNSTQGNEQQDLDPDTVAQEYADLNGITLEEAKKQLSAKFGEPEAK